jgi:hypothetical protein
MKRRLEESPDALLPPLKVPRYRYWECSECVENCHRSVSSFKNKIAEQQTDDSIHDKPCTTDKAESLAKLPKNDHEFLGSVMQNPVLVTMCLDTLPEEDAGLKAGEKNPTDMRSVEFSSENDREICHNEDDVVANSAVEPDDSIHDTPFIKGEANLITKVPKNECTFLDPYLMPMSPGTLQEETFLNAKQSTLTDISSGESSFEKDKDVHNGDDVLQNSPAEHLISQKISEDQDSDINSNATQIFCIDNKDQVFANHTGGHMKTKSDISDFIDQAEHLPHISGTVISVAICNPVEKIFNEDDHEISAEREKEKFIKETPRNHTLTSSIADGGYKEDCITEDRQVSAEKEKEKSITETPGNNTFASSITDEDYKEDCIAQNHQASAEKEKEKFINETPGNNTLTSSIVGDVYKKDWITQVSIMGEKDGILTKVKNHRAKRQKGKGKTLKKRLISDLIAVTPFEQLECNDVNWNCKVKSMSRKAIIGTPNKDIIRTWGVSKAAAYRLRKFKGNSKYSSAVRDKQDLGSYQSLASAKSLEEARNTVKRRFHSKKTQSSSEEMLSKSSRKKTPENGTQTELLLDQDDDVLNDLASFMAKNQYERHAPKSCNLEESECPRVSILRSNNSEAEDIHNVVMGKSQQWSDPFQMHNNKSEPQDINKVITEKSLQSRDPVQLHENDSLKEELVKGRDTLRYILSPYSSIDGQVILLDEDSPEANQVQEPVMPEKLEVSGPAAKEAEVISRTRKAIILSADCHACKNSEKGDLDKDINTERVNHKGSLVDASMMKTRNVNGFHPCQRKSTSIKKSIHRLKNLMKSSHDQLSLIKQTNAALNAALYNVRSQSVHVYNSGPDVSVPVGSCKDTQTVVGTSFSPVQTNLAQGFAHTQSVAHPVSDPTLFQMRPVTSNVLPNLANSKSSNAKTTQLPKIEGSSKGQREDAALAARYNPQESVQQPTMRESDPFLNPMMRSMDKDFTFESTKGTAEQANDNQGTQKPDMHMAQPPTISSFPASGVSGPPSTSILTGIPVINFPVEHRSKHLSNGSIFQPPSGEILSYFALKGPSSLIAEQTAEAAMCRDPCQPLRSPVILSFALGNKLDTETTLSQEFFDQGKFDLQSYLQRRIQSHYPSRASKSSTNEAVRGSEIKESQSANQNPVDVMDSGIRIQNNAVLLMNAEQHLLKNVKVRQMQADINNFPPISLPLHQTGGLSHNVNTGLEFADRQNHKRKQGTEASQAPTGNQVTVLGENLHTTLERRVVTNKKQVGYDQNNTVLPMNTDQHHIKNMGAKQVQKGSNNFPPISRHLLETDASSQNLNTGLEIADGQNYKRKQGTEASQAPTDNQVTVIGENLDTTLENRVTNKKQVGYSQNNAILLMKTDQHHNKNVKVKQVQEGSNTFPQIGLPLLQTDALRRNLGTDLEIADGQNCNRKSSTESSEAPTDNQATVLGENLSPAMENSVTNKKHAGYSPNNAVLFMNTDQHHIKNIKVEQIQANSNTFPPISLPLLQADALSRNLDTGLEIADGHNYNRKAGTEASQALADNQVAVLGENLHTTLENRVTNKKQVEYGQNNAVLLMNAYQHHIKNVKAKQVQAENNTSPPISFPLLQSDALRRNLDTGLEIADGQNCNRKWGTENQSTGLGENLNATLENRVTNKDYVGCSQNNAVLFMNADQHHIKNANVQQVQADSNTFPPNSLALLQTDALRRNLDTGLEVAHGQNCKRKRCAKSRLVPTDNQAIVPGENLNSTLESRETEIHIGNKIIRCNLVQVSSQTSKPTTMTDALGERDSMLQRTLRSGKLTESSNTVNNKPVYIPVRKRRKYVKKPKEAIVQRKTEAQSHCMQTHTRAAENCTAQGNVLNPSSQPVPSRELEPVKHFAGSQHVLKPIAQNTQQLLPVSPVAFQGDQQDKVAMEEILNTVQGSSQTSKPITTTVASGEGDSMLQKALRSGKLTESSNTVNNKPTYIPVAKRRKFMKKAKEAIAERKLEVQSHCMQTETFAAENCTTQGNVNPSSQTVASRGPEPVKHFAGSQHVPQRKLETESHCMQTEACATENCTTQSNVLNPSSQAVASRRSEPVKHFAGSQHVLRPIAQNTQQNLFVPPFPFQADLRDKVPMEERLNTVQVSSQASKPITMTDELGGGDSILQRALRSGNFMESSNIVNNMPAYIPVVKRRKYVRKAEKEARAQRKLETQSHRMQTETCAAENYTTQGNVLNSSSHAVASTGSEPVKHCGGSQHVLKPVTKKKRQLLPVPPVTFLVDQQDKVAAEERLNLASSKMSSECSRRKSRGQIPFIPNIFDRAIEDYIKRGIVSVLPLSPQTLPPKVVEPTKLGAGLPLDSRPEYYGKCVNPLYNPPKLRVQPNTNATENHVFVDTSSTGNIAVAPSAGNSNIAVSACTGVMPCNMMPQQPTVTPEMQAYFDRSKLNFFSFAHTDSTVAAPKDFQSEPNMTTESGVSEGIQKQRTDG